jgi:peptide/nickel transport system ATP-binding protein
MLITHDMGVIAEATDRVAVMYAGRLAEIGPTPEVLSRPKHPYTVGLMKSTPSTIGAGGRLHQIPGSMPGLRAIPPGCAFHPRCPKAFERCDKERPEPIPDGDGKVACWLYDPAERDAKAKDRADLADEGVAVEGEGAP